MSEIEKTDMRYRRSKFLQAVERCMDDDLLGERLYRMSYAECYKKAIVQRVGFGVGGTGKDKELWPF